jgi:hypothetical protein
MGQLEPSLYRKVDDRSFPMPIIRIDTSVNEFHIRGDNVYAYRSSGSEYSFGEKEAFIELLNRMGALDKSFTLPEVDCTFHLKGKHVFQIPEEE